MKRLSAIDALRGLAVIFMVMHHTVDSWVEPASRQTLLFAMLRHLGGVPAPAFMLLAGMSSALVAARERDKGVATRTRLWSGVKRGLYILGVALAFRVFVFFAGGNSLDAWRMLFRVDILNCMGVSLAVVAAACACARSWRQSMAIALSFAAVFALCSPWMASVHIEWPSDLVGLYVTGHGVMVLFPMFPWVAYLAVGYAAGEYLAHALKQSKTAGAITLSKATLPLFVLGVALFAGGWALEFVPFRIYPDHDYWHSGPLWVSMRLGVQLCLLAVFAFALRNDVQGTRAGFLQLLGRHSLLAYVFHVELVYGRLANPIKQTLSIPRTLTGVALLVGVCGALAWAVEWFETRRKRMKTPDFSQLSPTAALVPAEPPAG